MMAAPSGRFTSREDMLAMMKQLKKDGAGGWSVPEPPREKSPERETTPEQIRADAECVFAVLDYDGDGQVTKAELQAHLKESSYSEAAAGAIFDAIDVNDDGELSREELRGGLARYGALRLALGVGTYYDYGGVSPMPT